MPEEETIERAREDAAEGKAPSTQAGEFVREEMARVGLPHSLHDNVRNLAHIALEQGPGEAFNALAHHTRIDARLKERIRLILRGVLKYK